MMFLISDVIVGSQRVTHSSVVQLVVMSATRFHLCYKCNLWNERSHEKLKPNEGYFFVFFIECSDLGSPTTPVTFCLISIQEHPNVLSVLNLVLRPLDRSDVCLIPPMCVCETGYWLESV